MFHCRERTFEEMVVNNVLAMNVDADHPYIRALVAALPVRLKLLAVADSKANVQTFAPGAFSAEGGGSDSDAAGRLPAAAAAAADPQQVWLILEPGHFEVVSPAEAYKDLEQLPTAGSTV